MCNIVYSIKIFWLTHAGVPEVTLNKVPPVHLNKCVILQATIRGFSEYHSVIWTKHNQDKDYSDPKLEGLVHEHGSAVLCIENFKKEDEGTYTIEVHNRFGKGHCSQQLKVIGGNLDS